MSVLIVGLRFDQTGKVQEQALAIRLTIAPSRVAWKAPFTYGCAEIRANAASGVDVRDMPVRY